jgi:hypothetical protein
MSAKAGSESPTAGGESPKAGGGVRKPSSNPPSKHMIPAFEKFNSRCAAIRKAPLLCVPDRVAYIFSTREAATPEQAAAAERCCCPLCMQAIFDGSKAEFQTCSICHRRCCEFCSRDASGNVVCNSKTCAAVYEFMIGKLSPLVLSSECERISRDLLCQWLVLQSKKEAVLGPLRALYLVDARNAAMASQAAQAAAQTAQAAAQAAQAAAQTAPTEP